ncbi:MAG: betaine/proline/choline family ABC transporter ATP-binding protein [Oscillospiraceae bacterium]|nr:betaine/proline/choline family ABC transporter ATP-binding protein [Oscillospiraceae bacterium]
MIEFKNVCKSYGNTQILKNLSFQVNDGEFIALVGPSGCGKTTTLKTINRLNEIDSGQILIDNVDIQTRDKTELRRSIGYVIQQIGLFPNMTVEQNICVVPKLLKFDRARCRQITKELLKMLDMEEYAGRYPSELSGGQQQRVGVLRALAASPEIILMDEPFSALDPQTRTLLQDEVKNIQKKLGVTIMFVTHDMDEALKLADRIIFLDGGEIVQMDTPEQILLHPATERVKIFLGKQLKVEDHHPVSQFMKRNPVTMDIHKGILECAERIARGNVDSLIVTRDGKYAGTVTLADMRKYGHDIRTIEPITRQNLRTVNAKDDAKECFDHLLESPDGYVVVLNDESEVLGIVTKTSVAKSVAAELWGDHR